MESEGGSEKLSGEKSPETQLTTLNGVAGPASLVPVTVAANEMLVEKKVSRTHTLPDSPSDLLCKLLASIRTYLPESDVELVQRAFQQAVIAHEGQCRDSGEPYINHCIATGQILADFNLEAVPIAAALLHDVLEDTAMTEDDLRTEFGEEVAQLVRGVTKLSSFDFGDLSPLDPGDNRRRDRLKAQIVQAENLRKLFLAMADDIRVVLIKLADRLHNMRTLQALSGDRRTRIARETMEIYAPLAARLGIWQMKWQLEDLAFRHLDPNAYRRVSRALALTRAERERYIKQTTKQLASELARVGLRAQVVGRPKHLYSIYRKMQRTGLQVDQLHDLLGLRVILDGNEADCYAALGVVHQKWTPIPTPTGETGFRDYVAVPKENGYRSLHTTVMGPEATALEVQIRTEDMHRDADFGVAAHWRYKEGRPRDVRFEDKIAWIRQLLDWQTEMSGSAQQFVESLKSDVFRDQVYVFTPRGELRELPAGSTPLDFAYRIHTDIGHRCIGSKINGRLVALDYQLRNGDVVEIVTSKTPRGPSRDWMNSSLGFVKTAHAREKIRQWFKRQERAENIERGKEQLDKELSRLGLSHARLDDILQSYKLDKIEDLYLAIGCGEISPQSIVIRLAGGGESPSDDDIPVSAPTITEAGVAHAVKVMGVGDLLTRVAHCCSPVPGDEIVGFVTRGNGVTVHRVDCPNVAHLSDRERLVNVEWGRVHHQAFPAVIRLEAWDRDGLLRDVAALVAEDRVNMTSVTAITHPDHTATIKATLEVANIQMLSRILARMERIKGVRSVMRDAS